MLIKNQLKLCKIAINDIKLCKIAIMSVPKLICFRHKMTDDNVTTLTKVACNNPAAFSGWAQKGINKEILN